MKYLYPPSLTRSAWQYYERKEGWRGREGGREGERGGREREGRREGERREGGKEGG